MSSGIRPPRPCRRLLATLVTGLTIGAGAVAVGAPPAGAAAGLTTAWRSGRFDLDAAGVASRADLVLGRPNLDPTASIPLGNGALGVAAWAANGFTAQLNRSDTMPDRKSPGQVIIPGLSVISHAADFRGRLDVTDGVLEESGGGMSMKAWVSTSKDELIVDVAGADPSVPQTALLTLWPGRHPSVSTSGAIGTLAETWVDQGEAGASGRTFGSLSTITAGGVGARATAASATSVQVGFTPRRDGSFRVVVGSPAWTGGNAGRTARSLLGSDATVAAPALLRAQRRWWSRFWTRAGLVEMDSADGSAAYIENLRTLYLYEEAASMRAGIYPGSQAGEADMFAWSKDTQTWTPSSYWLWNLRAEISANLSSGNYQLNTPIFDMYIDDLPAIEAWTKQQMGGLPGACVPETMRFNGNGGDPSAGVNASCSEPSAPNWNALNVTSGPELSLYMWQQYQATDDRRFLARAYPFMQATAQFLLAYQHVGTDGLLHAVANAHETQWSVKDPTTDIAADRTVFAMVLQAGRVLGHSTVHDPLLGQLAAALKEIPPYPRTDDATRTQLLNPDYTQAESDAADATGTDMIAISYEPAAQRRNGENVELEPLWPWDDISDQDAALFAVEQRAYQHRPNRGGNDWSFDAVDAARLHRPSEVEANLVSLTKGHQVYPNGFADLGSSVGYQPYIEQEAGVATAVDEALAQDYDGIIRFAPAWPSDWDASGRVYLQHGTTADVQVEDGELVTAAIEAGRSGVVQIQNPWPGQRVQVVDGRGHHAVVRPSDASLISAPLRAGRAYLVERVDAPTTRLPFAPVTGSAPSAARHLGAVQLGLDPAGPAGTAVVGTVLGAADVDYGLSRVGADAAAVKTAGLTGRSGTDLSFDIDDAIAATSRYAATISVSYYDSGSGIAALQYDNGPSDRYRSAGTITRTGTDAWKVASFTVPAGYFGNLQTGGADFRLHATEPLTVHSVGVSLTGPAVATKTLFPPVPTVQSPKSGGTLKLADPISGTAEPDGSVTVSEGAAPVCTATADDSGAWSCAPAGGFTSGRHTITVGASDPTGMTGDASAPISFTASDRPPGTAIVGAVVGASNYSYGMSEDERSSAGFDGPTTASVIDGLTARTTTDSNIYFDIDDSIAHAGSYAATFTVAYYDQGTGSFAVQYDDGSSDPYRSTASIALTGTNTWKTATVSADNAYFGGAQHSDADFRLRNGGGQVTVHSVAVKITGYGVPTLTDFPPPVTITSPADGATVAATPAVSGTAEPGATVTVHADGGSLCTAVVAADGSWNCTAAHPLTAGTHQLDASSTDATATPATSQPVSVAVSG